MLRITNAQAAKMGDYKFQEVMARRRRDRNERARSAAREKDIREGLPRALVGQISRHLATLEGEAKSTFWKRLEAAVVAHHELDVKRSKSRDSARFKRKCQYSALVP